MSKRQDRPWDHPCVKGQMERAEAILAVPSVQLDSVIYKSDRFYLHAVDDDDRLLGLQECTCGSRQAPPLFHRERFVNSLQLEAAILGTYTIDVDWMARTFPQLVGPTSSVPTLILHGQKGRIPQLHDNEEKEEPMYDSDREEPISSEEQRPVLPSNNTTQEASGKPRLDFVLPSFSPVGGVSTPKKNNIDDTSIDGAGSFQTQEGISSPPTFALPSPAATSCKKPVVYSTRRSSPAPTTGRKSTANNCAKLGRDCHFTKVQSVCIQREDNGVTREPSNQDEFKRESKRGVHHPKFMLLFEKSGDVVVIVSTANLTRTTTTEGSWIQRFRKPQRRTLHKPPSSNDFGIVLTDFLEKLSQAAAVESHVKVDAFLSKHLHFGLAEMDSYFYFGKAQIHLVPTIPGDWKGRCTKRQPYLYGRQRVSDLLQKQAYPQNEQDRLVVQPTSFGGNWKRGEMADMVKSYLGNLDCWIDQELLDRVDVVWPSVPFMKETKTKQQQLRRKRLSPRSVVDAKSGPPLLNATTTPLEVTDSHVFLSSQAFNSCEVPVISRMARYQSSRPVQQPLTMVPHFKSVTRVLKNPKQREAIQERCGHAKEYLSWFLLTSSCFSHGAQGKRSSELAENEDSSVVYANFELGVLFTSRMQQERRRGTEDRVYCFQPKECSCQLRTGWSDKKLVHLPVPYSLTPKPYLMDENDSEMAETPFFHEILDGTKCVGNMLLTPYGASVAKEIHNDMNKKQKD
jgi:hypothetical protein